jgi:hypothetical protein
MTRNRAPIDGGYARKTISLPTELVTRIEAHLKETPGLTMSAFMSFAGEDRIVRIEKRKTKR